MNEPAMPAHPAQARALGVANARRSPSYGCALRLDGARLRGLLGHGEFIPTF
ncbi:hypothetical protein J2W30_000165 [Variovorax boronicumulans]|uniref:hypothetical protein n=1 Tax=Variovorax TaxID=34072 RepID=UPI00278AE363|nr:MULTISPECIES: hypothetical protein [Variovorax]MDQ0032424.1 hypothetical protein [Variovorax boronicumulans]MDQ0609783.1 hypothetical protein [Variovorax sp. W1I1]